MSYEKQNFTNGQVLTAEHMNHIEEGVFENDRKIGSISTALDSILDIQNELIGGDS